MYTLSPQERIALAQARIKNVPSYVPTIPRTTNTDIRSNYTPSVGARLLDTGVDIFGNVLTGIAKTFEGVYDWGAGLIGGAAGLFGNEEIQQRIQNHIAYDFIGNTLGKAVERGSQYSYVNELGEKGQNIVRGVASGVGQILPAVAITAATGGLGAPAALAQGLGTATFMAGAAGRGTEEAFQEGADYGKGLAYGGLTGLMEGAIEKLSGGLAKNVFGKGLIDGVVKKVAGKATTNAVLQKGFKLLLDAGGEGAEEAIAEILNPVLKRLTYDKDAPMATKEQILESALIGGLTSLAYQGSIGRIGAKSQNVTEGVKELQTLDKKENNLWARDKLTADEQTKLAEQRQSTLEEISRNLQRMNDEKRAKTIEQYRLGDKFALDGSLIEVEQLAEKTENIENKAVTEAVAYNKQAYSPSLYGKENTLAFKPTSQELTAEQKEAKVTFTSLNKGKRKVNLVFADMGKDESGNVINGAYKDGTLYVSTQAANPAEVVVKHELTHFAEGTKEYGKFASYVLNTIAKSENLTKQFGNVIDKINETSELYAKVNEGKSLSEAEKTVLTEVIAQYTSENLFTSQEQINRLARTERNFAQKILDWIKDKISVLKGKTKQEREIIAFLRKAEKLYSQALDEAWGAEDFAKGIKGETVAEDTKLSTTEQPLAKDENIKFSLRTKPAPTRTKVAYKLFNQREDGNLYPLYINPDNDSPFVEIGKWYDADEGDYFVDPKNGRKYVKAQGGLSKLAYRPGWHSGSVPFLDHIGVVGDDGKQYLPKNFVWAEVEVSADIDYQAEANSRGAQARDKALDYIPEDGYYKYKTNSNAAADQEWYISGALKVNRILNDDEAYKLSGKRTLRNNKITKDIKVTDRNGTVRTVAEDTKLSTTEQPLAKDETTPKSVAEDTKYSLTAEQIPKKTKKWTDGTGDIVVGDRIKFTEAVFEGSFRKPKFIGERTIIADVVNDSYGENKQQHTFTIIPIEATGVKAESIKIGQKTTRKGRNIYRNGTDRLLWVDESLRKDYADEKHQRGDEARRIRDERKFGGTKYSLTDSNGKKLTEAQAEFFKDSKARDEQGRLLVVYHGSPTGTFNVFRTDYGVYFTTNKEYAKRYTRDYERGDSAKIYECYINIEKPFDTREKKARDIFNKEFYMHYGNGTALQESGLPDWTDGDDLVDFLKEKGYDYDGLLIDEGADGGYGQDVTKRGISYVVFSPSQIKLTTNLNPTENDDIRYSLSPFIKAKMKSYTKAESEAVINDIITTKLDFGDKYGELKGKSKQQVIDQLWKGLNNTPEGKQMAVALDIADFIIENSVADTVYSDSNSEYDMYIIDTLKPYLRSIDLESIKADIKYKYGSDTNVFAMWGKRKGEKGIAPDVLAQELAEQGYVINVENPADIFFAIDESYKKALKRLKNKSKTALADILDKQEQKELRQDIAREVLKAYETKGKDSAFGKVIKDYEKQIADLKKALKETKTINKVVNNIVDNARRLKDYRKGEYIDASFLADARLDEYAKILSKLEFRGNLIRNPQTVRQAISCLDGFYTENILNVEGGDYFNPQIAEDIKAINERYLELLSLREKQGRFMPKQSYLTKDEYQAISRITTHIKHLYTKYNTVFFKGKSLDTRKTAQNGYEKLNGVTPLGEIALRARIMLHPSDVFEMTERYKKGILTDIYNELQTAVENKVKYQKEAKEMFADFFKANPKYEQSLRTQLDNGLTKGQALALYMTYNREHGRAYLTMEGAKIKVADDTQAKKGKYREATLRAKERQFDTDLLPKLTETDKQFIELLQNYFKWSGEQISAVEMQKWGVANPKEADYFPISISGDDIFSILGENRKDGFSLAKPSFTYKTTKASQKTLFIGNVIDILYSQINQASSFVGLSVPVNEIAKLYNVKLDDGKNLKQRLGEINRYFGDYLNTYLQDIQGINRSMDGMDRVLGKARSWMARAALGLNPKVWFNQLTSIPMARSVGLSYKNQIKGVSKMLGILKNKDRFVQEYNKLVEAMPEVWQRYEGSIAIKEALGLQSQNKFEKIMDITTNPIQAFDKFAIMSLWQGCLEQNNGDVAKATEMMKNVLRKTQPNYEALNRSEIGRSKNQLTKMFTMFMTQPLQNFSRMYTAIDKFKVAKQSKDSEFLKKAKQELAATTSGFVVQLSAYVMVAQLFKLLLRTRRIDKKGNEISLTADIARDAGGAVMGMFPLARDVYTYLTQGYEPTNAAYDGLSNILNASTDIWKGTEMLLDGKANEPYKIKGAYRRVLVGLSQTFGIPLRNLERYVTGTVGTFSPDFAIKYDSLFYKQNYTAELNKALEKGDEDLAESIIELMFDSKGLSKTDAVTSKTVVDLFGKGYNVLPRTVNTYVTVDGERIEMTSRQYKKFKDIYDGASEKVSKMIRSSDFGKLSENAQAKSIKYVYDYYYNIAVEDLIGIEADSKATLFGSAIDIEKLAMYISELSEFTTDKDKQGNAINGSLKAKIQAYVNKLRIPVAQKYMLMGYLGYKNANGEAQVQSYIRTLGLSKEKQKELLAYCGY